MSPSDGFTLSPDTAEAAAVRSGLQLVQMEVGARSIGAHALYRGAGYRDRGPFGTHSLSPFSRLLTEEAVRLLQVLGAETRVLDPRDLPMANSTSPDQRWPASWRHCFALDERRPTNGGQVHAAAICGRRSKQA